MGAAPLSLRVLFFLISISMLYIEVNGRIEKLDYIVANSPRDSYQRFQRSRIQRRDRACLINAGLSQGCDLSDILYAKYQANKFSSFAGPASAVLALSLVPEIVLQHMDNRHYTFNVVGFRKNLPSMLPELQ